MVEIVASIVFFVSLTTGGMMPKDEGIKHVTDPSPAYEETMEEEGSG